MHTWHVVVFGLVLMGWLFSSSRASEAQNAVEQEHQWGAPNLAHTTRERWHTINEIAALIDMGNFARA
jgi:hypothetical protein